MSPVSHANRYAALFHPIFTICLLRQRKKMQLLSQKPPKRRYSHHPQLWPSLQYQDQF